MSDFATLAAAMTLHAEALNNLADAIRAQPPIPNLEPEVVAAQAAAAGNAAAAAAAGNAASSATSGKATSASAKDAAGASRAKKASTPTATDSTQSAGSDGEGSSAAAGDDAPTLSYDSDVKPLVIKLAKLDQPRAAAIIGGFKNAETGEAALKAAEIDVGEWPALIGLLNGALSEAALA